MQKTLAAMFDFFILLIIFSPLKCLTCKQMQAIKPERVSSTHKFFHQGHIYFLTHIWQTDLINGTVQGHFDVNA